MRRALCWRREGGQWPSVGLAGSPLGGAAPGPGGSCPASRAPFLNLLRKLGAGSRVPPDRCASSSFRLVIRVVNYQLLVIEMRQIEQGMGGPSLGRGVVAAKWRLLPTDSSTPSH